MKFKMAFISVLSRLGLVGLYVRFQRFIMRISGRLVYVSTLPNKRGDFVCDGVDDQIEIQAAIDYVARQGGSATIEMQGTYNVEASIFMKSNVSLDGRMKEESP